MISFFINNKTKFLFGLVDKMKLDKNVLKLRLSLILSKVPKLKIQKKLKFSIIRKNY